MEMMMETKQVAINSHNEWDRLREVVVGTADHFVAGLAFSKEAPANLLEKAIALAKQAYPQSYLDEVNEDLEGLCRILKDFGAIISRPKAEPNVPFSTPFWRAYGQDIYNVRDCHLIVGNTVILSASPVKFRYFESEAFKQIWYHYFGNGFRWISAPKPSLVGDYVIPYNRDSEVVLTHEDVLHRKLSGGRIEVYHKLLEDEILFEAANIIRMGKDLIYLISSTGNQKGGQWLQSVLGNEYRVHTTRAYRSSHLDSTILPLNAGLVLLNSARVNPGNCPEIFEKWEKIYFEDMAPVPENELEFQKNVKDKVYCELKQLGVDSDLHHISSPFAGLNVLSLDPKTVLVHDRQQSLIRDLEKRGKNVIPVRMRHCYTMLGGLHCSTLDTVRESKLENYFE